MSRPSEWVLALAIGIVRSIPQDESVKDYLARLRAHIKPGSKSGQTYDRNSETSFRHLDTSEFWQAEHAFVLEKYDCLRRNHEEEQNITFSLKKQIEDLQLQALQAQSSGLPSHSVSKRKRTADTRQLSKKTRTNDHAVATTPAAPDPDFEALGRSNPGLKVLRSVRELHSMLRGQMYTVDTKILAFHASQTAQALSTVIGNLNVQPEEPHQRFNTTNRLAWETEVSSTKVAAARAFTTVLHSIKRLFPLSQGDVLVENVVYHSVEFFNSILSTIEAAATAEAKSRLAAPQHPPVKLKAAAAAAAAVGKRPKRVVEKSTKSSTNTSTSTSTSTSTFLMCEMTALIRVVIGHLNTELACHNQLLEGLLYFLLVRLGQIENLLTFSGPRSGDDMEDQIRNLPPLNDKEYQLDPARRLQRQAMSIEAPYMLDILGKAICAAPAAFQRRLPEGLPAKFYLTPHALKRLQRTLVDGVFGPGTRGDDASADFLKMPKFSTLELEVPDVGKHAKDGDRESIEADWFEEQLWSVVGWDILGAEEDL